MSDKGDATEGPPTDDEPEPEEEPEEEVGAEDTTDDSAEATETESEEAVTEDETEIDAEAAPAAAASAEPSGTAGAGALDTAKSWATTAPLWQVGVAAVLIAAVAAEIVGGLGKAFDVPMDAPQSWGSDEAKNIYFGGIAIATVWQAGLGVIVALLLDWKVKQAARIWLIFALVGTVLSFGAPITAENTTTATKTVLSIAHLVVAAIVIPLVYLRLTKLEKANSGEPAAEPSPA